MVLRESGRLTEAERSEQVHRELTKRVSLGLSVKGANSMCKDVEAEAPS